MKEEIRQQLVVTIKQCKWPPHPIDAIRFRMDQQGLKQCDLVEAGCGSASHVSEILNRKRKLNLRFIRAYHKLCPATPLKVLIQ